MTARIHILDVRPGIEPDGLPAKATVGDALTVRATVLCDPADAVSARVVLHDPRGRGNRWAPMYRETEGGWTAVVTPTIEGDWSLTVEAWSDPVVRWRRLAGAGLTGDEDLYLHDELTGAAHPWRTGTAFTLDPAAAPACVLTVRRL